MKNKDLKLSQRTWHCACGAMHDRDKNAAKNILNKTIERVPVENGELTPMESPKINCHEKWQLKRFEEVGKKVEKSIKFRAKLSNE